MENEEIYTFSANRQGFVCKTYPSGGTVLYYPDKRCLDFLENQFLVKFNKGNN